MSVGNENKRLKSEVIFLNDISINTFIKFIFLGCINMNGYIFPIFCLVEYYKEVYYEIVVIIYIFSIIIDTKLGKELTSLQIK